jgi:SET domain-containing protein
MRLEPSRKVYISDSKIPNAGRGVFAATDIAKDEIIEICPVIRVPLDDSSNKKGAVLVNYFFYFGDRLAVALGFGSIYNHQYEPNATYTKNLMNDTVEFKAIQNIKKNEEITVNYNYGKAGDKTLPLQKGIPPAT